jgi:RNA polymerase sigma-70 factor, ECF subfamily
MARHKTSMSMSTHDRKRNRHGTRRNSSRSVPRRTGTAPRELAALSEQCEESTRAGFLPACTPFATLGEASESQIISSYQYNDQLLRRWVRRYQLDPDEAADLVQETWVLAWQKRTQLRNRDRFSGWLLRICRTVCVRYTTARRRRREAENACAVGEGESTTPDPQALQDREDAVLDVVMRLAERQRRVLLLREVAGLSTAEVARILQCAPGTVKATRNQAIRRVRERSGLTNLNKL